MNFSSESCFSKKIELKIYFSEINFSPQNEYSKSFVLEICRNEKFSIQNLTFWKFIISKFHCIGKRLLQNLILFFGKISFQTLFFNEKVCYKVMPFKKGTKSEQLVVLRGANRVNTLFLRCDVFIEIWFLNENWIQNPNSRKKFSLHKTIIGNFFFEIRQDEKLSTQKLINL